MRHVARSIPGILAILLGFGGLSESASKDVRPPLFFEANQGQTDSRVQFLARSGDGYTLFLTATEAVFALRGAGPGTAPAVVRMTPVGASPAPEVSALEPLAGRVSYFVGKDPARWRRDVPIYARVTYRAVYRGIDLIFHASQGRLEYDFVVGPGADPGAIRLAFEGADSVTLDRGELVLGTPAGPLRMARPVLYQDIHGVRREVAGGYRLDGRQVGFAVGDYDRSRTLVIDPAPSYFNYLGGSEADSVQGILDAGGGRVYVAGTTTSANLPGGPAGAGPPFDGSYNPCCADVFVAELDPLNGAVVQLTYLGGSEIDNAVGIARDASGNIYVTGTTGSADFPTTPGALDPSYNGGWNPFVVKLDAALSTLLYSTFLGMGFAGGIAVDAAGNAYVGGNAGSGFPTTPGAFQPTFNGGPSPGGPQGGADAVVAKLNPAGSALVYATYLGGSNGNESIRNIAVDASGQAVVTGVGAGSDFPGTTGGLASAFVAKLTANGSGLVYATVLGRNFVVQAGSGLGGLAVDGAGAAYVVGTASGNAGLVTTPGAYQEALRGGTDAFVIKLDPAGAAVYSTFLGGSGLDGAAAIAVDQTGRAWVTGGTSSADFPTSVQCHEAGCYADTTLDGSSDAFVAILDPSGASLEYGTFLGGSGAESGGAIAIQATDVVLVGGSTTSTDFWFGGYRGGLSDGFVARLVVAAPAGGGCTGFRVGPTTATPSPVAPGDTETIQTRVCSGTTASNVLVDLEIYNTAGQKIAQNIFGGQSFAAGETRSYDWPYTVPSTLPAGTYRVTVGVFSGDWSTLYTWESNAATFLVGGAPPPPGSCTGGVTIGPTSAAPSPVARGATEAIQTRVCSGSAMSNLIVDLEIYDSGGQKVAQNVIGGQSFAAGESKPYRWDLVVPSSFADGTYTVKIGVFSGDWSVLHKWENQAATFQVGGGSPPPSASCAGGITIGPTSATPSPVARGATEAIQTRVCSGSAMPNLIIDLEIYDAGGRQVAQRFFSGQTFAAGEAKSYGWDYVVPATLASGTYTVKIGVFSGDWSTLHEWDNQAATFVVQ